MTREEREEALRAKMANLLDWQYRGGTQSIQDLIRLAAKSFPLPEIIERLEAAERTVADELKKPITDPAERFALYDSDAGELATTHVYATYDAAIADATELGDVLIVNLGAVGSIVEIEEFEGELCQRCGAGITGEGCCEDKTCPFSAHAQTCPAGWKGHSQHVLTGDGLCVCQ